MIQIKAHAKINLALDILGKNEKEGYHELQTVFTTIPLYDELTIEEKSQDSIEIDWKPLHFNLTNQKMGTHIIINPNEFLLDESAFLPKPNIEENTAYKAAKLIKREFHIDKGVKIKIKKNIPMRSGLGGGSSNAAAVLKALNILWNLGLNPTRLQSLGKKISKDVPFFIEEGTALGTHFGEEIEILPNLDLRVHLYHTAIEIHTHEAFNDIDIQKCGQKRKITQELVERLKKRQTDDISQFFHNDFEPTIFKKFPILHDYRKILYEKGAIYSGISGSGGILFGVS